MRFVFVVSFLSFVSGNTLIDEQEESTGQRRFGSGEVTGSSRP